MRLLVPFGTRPEAVKLAPVLAALAARGVALRTVATGQHYEAAMADAIWDELELVPDVRWELPAGEGERAGALLARAHEELATAPDAVLVLGDTRTVPVFSLAARARGVPLVHVEAGLRSFNETSLEETNRRIAAACASLHFAPTALAAERLVAEGVPAERIRIVGNPAIDALVAAGVRRVSPDERGGVLFTAHRPANVDDPLRLDELVRLLLALVAEAGPVTFPVHPRTRHRLAAAGALARLSGAGVALLDPLPYGRLLELLAVSRVVVTDSGGLQEEASWLGVPSVVLRRSTPRWEAVLAGSSRLVGLDADEAVAAVRALSSDEEQERVAALPCPFGDGHAAERIAETLTDPATAPLLRLEEPDYVGRTPPGGIEAVLFDLDDTLFSQEAWLEGAWRAVAEVVASLWEIDRDAFHDALLRIAADGSAQGAIIDRALAEVGAAEVPVSWRLAMFRAFRPATLEPYPGVRAALAELRELVLVGLVTDGDPDLQRAKLEALDLADAFDAVVFSDELGPSGRKPSPEPFRRAAAALGVDPRHVAFVGDNPDKDVAGALAAGLLPLRVRTGEYAAVPDGLPSWQRAEDAAAAIELLRPRLAVSRRARSGVLV